MFLFARSGVVPVPRLCTLSMDDFFGCGCGGIPSKVYPGPLQALISCNLGRPLWSFGLVWSVHHLLCDGDYVRLGG